MTLLPCSKKLSRALYLSEIEICCKFSVNFSDFLMGKGSASCQKACSSLASFMAVHHENVLCLDEV